MLALHFTKSKYLITIFNCLLSNYKLYKSTYYITKYYEAVLMNSYSFINQNKYLALIYLHNIKSC